MSDTSTDTSAGASTGLSAHALTPDEAQRDAERILAEIASQDLGTDPFVAAVRATRMPMIISDPRRPDNPVVFANDAFCNLTGYTRQEILGRNCRFLQAPESDPETVAKLGAAVREARSIQVDIRNRRKNGELFWNRLLMAPVKGADGKLAYFFGSQVDVTLEREKMAGLESANAALMAEVSGRLHRQKDSEARLRYAAEAGRLGLWELDLHSGALSASPVCRADFGCDADGPLGLEDLTRGVHPEDRPALTEALDRSVATGADLEVEVRVLRDAAVGWVQLRAQVVSGLDGLALRVAGVSLDITARQNEAARRRALVEFADATRDLEAAEDIVYAASEIIGRALGVCRAGYGVIDRAAETITIESDWHWPTLKSLAGVLKFREHGSYIEDLKRGETVTFADSDKDPRTAATTETLKAIQAQAAVNMPLTEQGGFVALLFATHDRPRAWTEEELVFLRDMAERTRNAVERRRTERELRESEAHYRYAAELNPQVTWTATPDGQLDRVAERWRDWTGTSGLGESWAEGLHPDDRERTGAAWTAAFTTGQPYDVEHRVARIDVGGYRWTRSRAYPRHDGSGRIVKWYGSTEDVHEQHVAQEALRTLNETLEQRVAQRTHELEAAQEALRQSQKLEAMGQLTGGVAHDFNNLLTPIIGGLDIISRRGLDGERERRLLDGALQSAERAKTLVQRLLAFARRQPLQAGAVDLAALIAGMADLVASTSGPKVRVEVEVDPALPPVHADANQLEMAILNLSVNARDAMPDGGALTLSAKAEHIGGGHPMRLAPGDYARLVVADTGSGMDADTLARAVEPFFSTKGVGQGTGLGLSMVHGLALQLGGALAIDSRPGAGTAVELWLPLSQERPAGAEASAEALRPGGRLGAALLVDDEDLVRASTAGMLEEIGYEVIEAVSAEDALRRIEGGLGFDLLVTDHLMPGMTGAELARAVQRLYPATPVLVISGYADAGGIASDLRRLTKPFREVDLASAVEALKAASPAS